MKIVVTYDINGNTDRVVHDTLEIAVEQINEWLVAISPQDLEDGTTFCVVIGKAR